MSNSRFERQSHVIWHCQYHIVWVPKYRYRVLSGPVKESVENCIQLYSSKLGLKIIELNVRPDHIHLLVKIPPKRSISQVLGTLKGKSAVRILTQFPNFKKRLYWGNHFWAEGYCVDTVGLDAEMIRKYVKHQEEKEKREDRGKDLFGE